MKMCPCISFGLSSLSGCGEKGEGGAWVGVVNSLCPLSPAVGESAFAVPKARASSAIEELSQ